MSKEDVFMEGAVDFLKQMLFMQLVMHSP